MAKYTTYNDLKSRRGYPWSRQHLRRLVLANKFPAPVPLGANTNAWLDEDLDAYAELYGDPDVLEVARALMQEAAAVGRAAGARLPDDIVERSMTNLSRLPAGMYASMYHDYAKGGPIEIEGMSGYIVREGRRLGVPTPHHATIYALLKPHRAGTPGT